MKALCCAVVVSMVAAAAAQAQNLGAAVRLPPAPPAPLVLLAPPAATLATAPAAPFAGLAGAAAAVHPYMGNAADSSANAVMNGNKSAFDVWVTDPRLYAGLPLTPNLAVEAGIANLYDRGTFHAANERRENVAGAFAQGGFNSYLAGKLTLPVTPHLQAYGKLGRAYSEFNYHDDAPRTISAGDVGPYVGVGAQYRLNEKASVTGGYDRYGDSQKWGGASNNNGLSAKVRLGF